MRQKSRGGKGIEKNLQKSCSKDAADAGRTDSVTKTAGWVDEAIKVNSKDAGIKGFDETDAAGKSQRERHRKSCRKVAVKIRQAPAGPIRQRIHQLGRCDRKIEQQISGRKVAEEMLQQRCGRRRQYLSGKKDFCETDSAKNLGLSMRQEGCGGEGTGKKDARLKLRKRLEYFQPAVSALFGVELGAVDIFILYGRRDPRAVVGNGRYIPITSDCVVGMDKVDIFAVLQVLKDGTAPAKLKTVPPYLRYFKVCFYGHDSARYQSEARLFIKFQAFVEQKLHTETYAQNGLALFGLSL